MQLEHSSIGKKFWECDSPYTFVGLGCERDHKGNFLVTITSTRFGREKWSFSTFRNRFYAKDSTTNS